MDAAAGEPTHHLHHMVHGHHLGVAQVQGLAAVTLSNAQDALHAVVNEGEAARLLAVTPHLHLIGGCQHLRQWQLPRGRAVCSDTRTHTEVLMHQKGTRSLMLTEKYGVCLKTTRRKCSRLLTRVNGAPCQCCPRQDLPNTCREGAHTCSSFINTNSNARLLTQRHACAPANHKDT